MLPIFVLVSASYTLDSQWIVATPQTPYNENILFFILFFGLCISFKVNNLLLIKQLLFYRISVSLSLHHSKVYTGVYKENNKGIKKK